MSIVMFALIFILSIFSFFLVDPAEDLSIYHLKTQVLVSLLFYIVLLVSISFILALVIY